MRCVVGRVAPPELRGLFHLLGGPFDRVGRLQQPYELQLVHAVETLRLTPT